MFPKRIKEVDTSLIKIQQRFLVKNYELQLDRSRCVGCGICCSVCPKDAIKIGSATPQRREKKSNIGGELIEDIDEHACVYCGTCTIMCPFDALSLFEDGTKVKIEDLSIVQNKALPKFHVLPHQMSQLKREAKIYWDGTISLKFQFPSTEAEFKEQYSKKCPGDCHKCDEICPNEAITFKKVTEAWKSKTLLEIDDKKCIKCGACANICPLDYFDVKWTKINTSGIYTEIFWTPIEEKLLNRKLVLNDKIRSEKTL